MAAHHGLRLAFAAMAALAAVRAPAAEPGVCLAVSGDEHEAAARAAARSLGVPSVRVDVRRAGEREALASRCGRLVVAVGSRALRAASEAAPRPPLVHVMADAPAAGTPGVLPDADPRRVLDMLQRLAPAVRRIGAVYDPGKTGALVADAQAAAKAVGIEIVALPVRSVGEAVRAYHRFERELRVDALWLLPDGTATVQETVYYAMEIAHWRRMVLIGLSRWYVASGALFALVPTPEGQGAAAGEMGQQVLRGAAPEGPAYSRDLALYVNERTAERLGLAIPRKVLEGAAQVLP